MSRKTQEESGTALQLQSLLSPLHQEQQEIYEECEELLAFLENFNPESFQCKNQELPPLKVVEELALFPALPTCATRSGLLPLFKILVVGDRGVGKTTFLEFYCNIFREIVVQHLTGSSRKLPQRSNPPTEQLEFFLREIKLPSDGGPEGERSPSVVAVQFWDTPGDLSEWCGVEDVERVEETSTATVHGGQVPHVEEEDSDKHLFLKNVGGIFFLYNVNHRPSLLQLPHYYATLRKQVNRVHASPHFFDDVVCYVVGNQMDVCPTQHPACAEEGETIAHVLNMKHYLVSSVFSPRHIVFHCSLLLAFTQMVLTVSAMRQVKEDEGEERASRPGRKKSQSEARKRYSQVDVSGIGNHFLSQNTNPEDENCSIL